MFTVITKYDEHVRPYSHVGITQCMNSLQKMTHDVLFWYHAQIAEVYKIKHAAISSKI